MRALQLKQYVFTEANLHEDVDKGTSTVSVRRAQLLARCRLPCSSDRARNGGAHATVQSNTAQGPSPRIMLV